MKQQNYRVAAYCRLSLDDETTGDSASIITQKQIIDRYIDQQGWTLVDTYIDDGYSGTNFERPNFQRMVTDIESGRINCVITKDLSRLGRNYIKTGLYTECFFPEHGVRYIAINDSYDSENTDNDIAPFKNIVNEWYSRDQSKKVKTAMRNKALSGKHLSGYPSLGYIKDPMDNGKYLVDEETAWIIKKIFDWSVHGYGDKKIQKLLFEEKIPTPAWFLFQKYGIYSHVFEGQPEEKRYMWQNNAVRKVLSNQLYLGHTVTFKSGVISYKNQKQVQKPKEDWIIVRDTHEPIISEEQFELVEKMHRQRLRPTKGTSEPYLLAGIAKCADCGSSMKYTTRVYEGKTKTTVTEYLCCMNYAIFSLKQCSMHYINLKDLEQAILQSVRTLATKVCADEKGMLKKLIESGDVETKAKTKQLSSEQKKLIKRKQQLDALFLKLYEDRVTGQVSDEQYKLLTKNFEKEKVELAIRLDEIEKFLTEKSEQKHDMERWVGLIKKYKDIESLDRYIANELFEKILIGESETIDGIKKQKISILYRFVGDINCHL